MEAISTSTRARGEGLELADYFTMQDERIYYALHRTELGPKARVLLVGPFVSERPHRYIPWVRWARFLAANGFETMRFDFRGCGESTGRFEDYGFKAWQEDTEACCRLLQARSPDVPVLLHGLGMGALVAQQAFSAGYGAAISMWMPPLSAREGLYQQLQLKLANDFVLRPPVKKTRDQYVEELEAGTTIEVEGYLWTKRLWDEAAGVVLHAAQPDSGPGTASCCDSRSRPQAIIQLDALGVHLFGGVGPNPCRQAGAGRQLRLVNPDLSATFKDTLAWLEAMRPVPCL